LFQSPGSREMLTVNLARKVEVKLRDVSLQVQDLVPKTTKGPVKRTADDHFNPVNMYTEAHCSNLKL